MDRKGRLENYAVESTCKTHSSASKSHAATQARGALKAGVNEYHEWDTTRVTEAETRRDPRAAIAVSETLDQAIICLSRQGFLLTYQSETHAQW